MNYVFKTNCNYIVIPVFYIQIFGFNFRRFDGNDEECTNLIEDNNTTIFGSSGSHEKGSSKLTLKNFVDFNWDHRYYHGQLIAIHVKEEFIAYSFSKRKYFTTNITNLLIYFNCK